MAFSRTYRANVKHSAGSLKDRRRHALMSYTGTSGPLYTEAAHFQVGRAAETTRGHVVLTLDRGYSMALS